MLFAKDIMCQKPLTVPPEMPVEQLASFLWEHRIGGAPVVDQNGALIGVVTESDLIDRVKRVHIPTVISILDSFLVLERPGQLEREVQKMTGTKVGDICSREAVSVSPEATIEEVATLMARKKAHTLPVVADNRVIGVIGKGDIVRSLARLQE